MTFLPKPKVRHPSLPKNSLGLTRRDYEGGLSTLCAGCGHDSITAAIIEASWGLDIEPQNMVKLSGIGCSSKTTAYFVSRRPRLQLRAWTHAVHRHGCECREPQPGLCRGLR